MRKDRKIKKQMTVPNNPASANKPIIEPRVIPDDPFDDADEEMIFDNVMEQRQGNNPFGGNSTFDQSSDQDQAFSNVFTRLSQLGNKSRGAPTINTSLNVSQTHIQPQTPAAIERQISLVQNYDEDGKWKSHMSKEQAH